MCAVSWVGRKLIFISTNVCGYEKLPKAIWVEALQEPSLISAVMCPERIVAE